MEFKPNPKLDLVLDRTITISPDFVWRGWTEPELLKKWFCPLPWRVSDCIIDLRPGGKFFTVMQGPAGEKVSNEGCFLEIIPKRKLVWTSALLPDYRPMPKPTNGAGMPFTAIILIEPQNSGTHYTAIAMHKDEADCETHAKMGFHQGWGMALDQLVKLG